MLERLWGKENTSALLVGEKLAQPFWISVWPFLRKLINKLPQDPAIPLWGIYPNDAQSCHNDLCSAMFITALFVIDRTENNLNVPLDQRMVKENVAHLHNRVLRSRKTIITS